jgi:hypothetical protein
MSRSKTTLSGEKQDHMYDNATRWNFPPADDSPVVGGVAGSKSEKFRFIGILSKIRLGKIESFLAVNGE